MSIHKKQPKNFNTLEATKKDKWTKYKGMVSQTSNIMTGEYDEPCYIHDGMSG